MTIPTELLDKWKLLRSHGDHKKIVEKSSGIIEMDVSRAFSKGECSDKVFQAIAAFYKKKEQKIKGYLI